MVIADPTVSFYFTRGVETYAQFHLPSSLQRLSHYDHLSARMGHLPHSRLPARGISSLCPCATARIWNARAGGLRDYSALSESEGVMAMP